MIYEDEVEIRKLLRKHRTGGGYGSDRGMAERKFHGQLLPKDFDSHQDVPFEIQRPAEMRLSLAKDPSNGSYTKE